MNAKPYVVLSALIFAMVALAHLARALCQAPIAIADFHLPVWLSWIGAAVSGALSAWGFTAALKRK